MSRVFILGVVCGVLLCGCAAFSYKYYGLEGASYDRGKLLGPEPKFDKAFSDCAPTAKEKHPCTIMFTPEFKAFKTAHLDCLNELENCQRMCGQQP